MVHAYNKMYLESAQKTLGTMLDVAINEWGYKLSDFYNRFLDSVWSVRFAKGDTSTLVGKSGIELAYAVHNQDDENLMNVDLPINRSPEYWTGWALAYYQWNTGKSFQKINEEVPIEMIVEMYHPFHEMDISQFVDRMNEIRSAKRVISYLKAMRIQCGMTQKELAELSEIPLKTIQQYEQRQKNINKAQCECVLRLAQVLNCDPGELLEN